MRSSRLSHAGGADLSHCGSMPYTNLTDLTQIWRYTHYTTATHITSGEHRSTRIPFLSFPFVEYQTDYCEKCETAL